jgi:hypothetical protein
MKTGLFKSEFWKETESPQSMALTLADPPPANPVCITSWWNHVRNRTRGKVGSQRTGTGQSYFFFNNNSYSLKSVSVFYKDTPSIPVYLPVDLHLLKVPSPQRHHTEDQASTMWTLGTLTPQPNHDVFLLKIFVPLYIFLHIWIRGICVKWI